MAKDPILNNVRFTVIGSKVYLVTDGFKYEIGGSGGSGGSGGTSRDFTVEPINLATEVTGTLPDAKIPSTIARTANYYTTVQIDNKLVAKANAADVYTKSQTDSKLGTKANSTDVYTKTETNTYVATQIANLDKLSKKIVDTLPADADASANTIYMLKKTTTSGTEYDLYTLIDGKLESIGDTTIDLSAYAKTADLSAYAKKTDLSPYAKTADIQTVIDNSHKHTNKTQLDKITEDAAGNMLYNGKAVSANVSDSYSTAETVIGTWIDGKPLYKRTFVTTSPSSIDTTANIVTLDASIRPVNMYGFLVPTGGHQIPLNIYNTAAYSAAWHRLVGGNYIGMMIGAPSYINRPVYVTIEYTKTTD